MNGLNRQRTALNEMMNRIFFLTVCALSCLSGLLPAKGNVQQRQTGGHTIKLAVGVLYSYGGGSHIQYAKLKTQKGVISFAITDGTRTNFASFKQYQGAFDKNWWNLGAEWRVTYEVPNDPNDEFGPSAESVTFTGHVEPSIAGANAFAYQYLDLLSNKNGNQAYAKLSSVAKQNLSLDDFLRMYRSVDVSMRAAVVCSHSADKVILLLAPSGVDGNTFQRCEITRVSAGWYINRLSGFQQSDACSE